jgi:hypothetical protein
VKNAGKNLEEKTKLFTVISTPHLPNPIDLQKPIYALRTYGAIHLHRNFRPFNRADFSSGLYPYDVFRFYPKILSKTASLFRNGRIIFFRSILPPVLEA